MGGRRGVHCIVAGSPISHSLTPILSLLVDSHLNNGVVNVIIGTSKYETEEISELLGQIILGRDLGSKKPKNHILKLVENATNEIIEYPSGWGVEPLQIIDHPNTVPSFGDSPLVWVSITSPLKHGLTSRSGVVPSDNCLDIASTNHIRWDGHRLVTGSTDGLGVVLVARSFGLFSLSSPPLLILRGGGAAARSVAKSWSDTGGKIHSVGGRRPLDARGPWASALVPSLKDRGLSPTMYIDFDSRIDGDEELPPPEQVDIHLSPSYREGGSVMPLQESSGSLRLDGRWMLAAQHLIAWSIFIEPDRRHELPSLPLLLSRLSDVETNLRD
jgi:hypothetical protein